MTKQQQQQQQQLECACVQDIIHLETRTCTKQTWYVRRHFDSVLWREDSQQDSSSSSIYSECIHKTRVHEHTHRNMTHSIKKEMKYAPYQQ